MRRVTPELEQEIIDMHNDKMSGRYIRKVLRVSCHTVTKVLTKHGLKIMPEPQENIAKKNKYSNSGLSKEEWLRQAKARVDRLIAEENGIPANRMSLIDAIHYFYRRRKAWERRQGA